MTDVLDAPDAQRGAADRRRRRPARAAGDVPDPHRCLRASPTCSIRLPVFLQLGDRRTGFDGVGLAALLDGPVVGGVVDAVVAGDGARRDRVRPRVAVPDRRSAVRARHAGARVVPGVVGPVAALREPDGAVPLDRGARAVGRCLVARRSPTGGDRRAESPASRPVRVAARPRIAGAGDHLRDRRRRQASLRRARLGVRRHAAQPRRVRGGAARPPRRLAVAVRRVGSASRLDVAVRRGCHDRDRTGRACRAARRSHPDRLGDRCMADAPRDPGVHADRVPDAAVPGRLRAAVSDRTAVDRSSVVGAAAVGVSGRSGCA